MSTYYRNDAECTSSDCYCKVISSPARLTCALRPCIACGCTWSDEPPGAGRDYFGRPNPQTHPEFWSE